MFTSFESFIPKHHVLWHLLDRMSFQGNPNIYSNWIDEDLNKTLKACCKNVSQATFEASALLKMREILVRSKRPLDRS